jgi:diguanylate cyclase (GGDEF)-like protein
MDVALAIADLLKKPENEFGNFAIAENRRNMDSLLSELERMKKKSDWLARMNDLHGRLAGAVDMNSMLEAFSIWLMPLVDHDLLGYNHIERQRGHMFCSSHGPERRQVLRVAEKTFAYVKEQDSSVEWRVDDFWVRLWKVDSRQANGRLLLVRQGRKIDSEEVKMIGEALDILSEPLRRALDYEDLFEQVRRDTLTGLANRRVFNERIPPLLAGAERHGRKITLCSMDLDKFKQINDKLGHAEGDRVLQKVAITLAEMVRGSDILVRMGGDEFILVLPETDLQAANKLAQRITEAIDRLGIYSSPDEKLGISIGLAEWSPGLSQVDWLQKADELLYQAKNTGRGRTCM